MIALYLLAAHLTGDFLLQTRWQAVEKFTDWRARAWHVAGYTLPFIPLAAVYAHHASSAVTFLVALAVLHFATDSRRFLSTVGDVVQWRLDYYRNPRACLKTRLEDYVLRAATSDPSAANLTRLRTMTQGEAMLEAHIDPRWPPPNPWPPMSLMIDQTLHIVQIAVLAGLLLR